jgi:subtilisin family serine protease
MLSLLALAFLMAAASSAAGADVGPMRNTVPMPKVLGTGSSDVMPGEYVVGLRDDATSSGVLLSAERLADKYDGKIENVWHEAVRGFSVRMSASQAKKLAADPNVAWVEQEHTFQPRDTQVQPILDGANIWGVDRLDQRKQPVDALYHYQSNAGAGVHIYVIDSGIYAANTDFGGRVTLGPNFVVGENPPRPDSNDCFGHGTEIAGLAAGAKYGVAKAAQLVALRVFDCRGMSGVEDSVVSAIDYVIANGVKPAVINLSLGPACKDESGQQADCPAGAFHATVEAEKSAIQHGIPVVTAAGEIQNPEQQPIDDCGANPMGAVPGAIDVGAIDSQDRYAFYSNFGACINIWAPGTKVQSDSFGANATTQDTGTSFAAGYVSGAVAVLLGSGRFADVPQDQLVARVTARLEADATLGQIGSLPDLLSPNLLLYVPPTLEGSSVALARTSTGALQAFGTNAAGNLFFTTQTGKNATTWNGWTLSVNSGWLSAAADANADGRVELLGLTTGANQVFQRQQKAVGSPDFIGWSQLSGSLQSVAAARQANGLVQLVGVNKEGQAWYSTQTGVGAATFSAWTQFTGTGSLPPFTSIAAEADSSGVVNVFAVDAHGRVWQTQQAAVNGAWLALIPFSPASGRFADEVAVARDGTGRLDLVTIGADGVFQVQQTAPGALSWGGWAQAVDKGDLTHIAAETNDNGTVALLAVDANGTIWQSAQTAAGSTAYTTPTTLQGALRP